MSPREWPRVTAEGTLIIVQEPPVTTLKTVEAAFSRIADLTEPETTYRMLIDLRETDRPAGRVRAALRRRLTLLAPRIERAAICTGRNFLLNTAARFVMKGLPFPFTIHKSYEEARAALA